MGTDRRVYNVQCNNCNAWGHYSRECPRAGSTVSIHSNKSHSYNNALKYILDTGSTHTTVNNNADITNLFKSNILQMKSSTGNTLDYSQAGILQPFGIKAYYNKHGAANIISFHELAATKDAYMVYDSRVADCFRLRFKSGKEYQFKNCGDGLYSFINPKVNEVYKTDVPDTAQYIQTVSQNEQLMTTNEIERAKAALEIQEYLGWPSVEEFLKIVRGMKEET